MKSFPYRSSYIIWHLTFKSLSLMSHKMSSLATSSKLTLSNSLSPPLYPPSGHTDPSASHWSLDSVIPKPKPAMRASKSLRNLGFHPPYAINDIAYLQHSSPYLPSPHYDPYRFEGSHVTLTSQNNLQYTAVFRSAGQCGYNAVAFETEEDCQIDRRSHRIPTIVVWLRTVCCPCF